MSDTEGSFVDDDEEIPDDKGWLLAEDLDLPRRNQTPKASAASLCPRSRCFALMAACGSAFTLLLLLFLYKFTNFPSQAFSSATIRETNLRRPETKGGQTDCPDFPWSHIRLPNTLLPRTYSLQIQPNLTTFVFKGQVEMRLEAVAATDLVVIHSKHLRIHDDYRVSGAPTGGSISVGSFATCEPLEQIAFRLSRKLQPKETLVLRLSFDGNLTTSFVGLYRSGFLNEDQDMVYSAVTQFEPTDARAMFPCMDEPALKARFRVSIVRSPDDVSLANMDLKSSRQLESGLILDEYRESVQMSTYLVAVAVLQDFAHISSTTRSAVKISIHTPAELLGDANFALDIAVDGLEFLENFFNISFPLPKQDLLAVSDFSAGAMENWGLITFRDHLLLFNSSVSTTASKERIGTVIVHELAHQWFGNLVTMKWWKDLWLNEGFASFVEYYGTAQIRPDWQLMDAFYMENNAAGLYLDALVTSHPVSVPVRDPAEIGSIFDAISYQKGAAFINMVMSLSGLASFSAGLNDYLNRFQYRNAEGADLWNVLNEHMNGAMGGIGLREFAEAWTTQVGYPLVRLTLSSDRTRFTATQTRFLFLEESRKELEQNGSWPIPLTYKCGGCPESKVWLCAEEPKVSVDFEKPIDWLLANTNGTGFYRVLYDKKLYRILGRKLKQDPKFISGQDKTVLLHDAFSLLKAGLLDLKTVFDLVDSMRMSDVLDRGPWRVVLSQLAQIEDLLHESDHLELFKDFERAMVTPIYEQLGWELSDNHRRRLLQISVLATACTLQMSHCISRAKELFNMWLKDKNSISADLKPLAVSVGVRYGNLSVWEQVAEAYRKSRVPSEQNVLMRALGATRDPWLLSRYLRMSLDPTQMKPNLLSRALSRVAGNPVGQPIAWRFLRMNWKKITDILGTTSMLGGAIQGVISGFCTTFDLEEAEKFFADKELGKVENQLKQTLESVRVSIQWKRLNEASLVDWLHRWRSTSG